MVSLIYIYSVINSSITVKMWILWSKYQQKLAKLPIFQFAIFAKVQNNTTELAKNNFA